MTTGILCYIINVNYAIKKEFLLKNYRKHIIFGLLIALEVVLTRFIQIPVTLLPNFEDKVSLGFLPVFLAGSLYGVSGGGAVAAIGDILRAVVFPQGGSINLLYTVNATLRGVTYGAFLHSKVSLPRILLASAVILTLNIFLLGFFISFSIGTDYFVVLLSRIPTSITNFIVQSIMLCVLGKPLERRLSLSVRK